MTHTLTCPAPRPPPLVSPGDAARRPRDRGVGLPRRPGAPQRQARALDRRVRLPQQVVSARGGLVAGTTGQARSGPGSTRARRAWGLRRLRTLPASSRPNPLPSTPPPSPPAHPFPPASPCASRAMISASRSSPTSPPATSCTRPSTSCPGPTPARRVSGADAGGRGAPLALLTRGLRPAARLGATNQHGVPSGHPPLAQPTARPSLFLRLTPPQTTTSSSCTPAAPARSCGSLRTATSCRCGTSPAWSPRCGVAKGGLGGAWQGASCRCGTKTPWSHAVGQTEACPAYAETAPLIPHPLALSPPHPTQPPGHVRRVQCHGRVGAAGAAPREGLRL
jgi:hypothetical protein